MSGSAEHWKALAAILVAAVAISAVGRLGEWLHPPAPQTIIVHVEGATPAAQP